MKGAETAASAACGNSHLCASCLVGFPRWQHGRQFTEGTTTQFAFVLTLISVPQANGVFSPTARSLASFQLNQLRARRRFDRWPSSGGECPGGDPFDGRCSDDENGPYSLASAADRRQGLSTGAVRNQPGTRRRPESVSPGNYPNLTRISCQLFLLIVLIWLFATVWQTLGTCNQIAMNITANRRVPTDFAHCPTCDFRS